MVGVGTKPLSVHRLIGASVHRAGVSCCLTYTVVLLVVKTDHYVSREE